MIHLELTVPAVWSRVRDAREALIHAAHAVGLGEDCAYAIGLVASELLENAIKYGTFASEEPSITLVVHMAAGTARVVVTNPVDGRSEHPHRLRAAVTRLSDATSPLEAYLARMTEILEEEPAMSQVTPRAPTEPERSGLGIFRVAHEAESAVSLRFIGEGSVEVTASMTWSSDGERELVA